MIKRILFLATFVVSGATLRAEWVETDSSIGWSEGGELVWGFSYDRAFGKPFFHPLRVPGGPELTDLRPDDHRWHYGLWFSWKYINGANFWEEDAATGKSEGTMTWRDPKIEKTEDGGVIIRIRIDYASPAGVVDLAEYRDLVVSPVERNGKYMITWTSHFTAGPNGALLDRTPLPDEPDGKLWGGYAGLSLRLAAGEKPVSFATAEGPVGSFKDDRARLRTQAVAATPFPDERVAGSIAILADPRSIEGAHPWYLNNGPENRFFCAAALLSGPRKLEPGEVWELSYRVVVRPRPWDAEDLETELFRWLNR